MSVIFHPTMTAQQLAEWCFRNRCYIEISYLQKPDGSIELLVLPHREPEPRGVVVPFPTTPEPVHA